MDRRSICGDLDGIRLHRSRAIPPGKAQCLVDGSFGIHPIDEEEFVKTMEKVLGEARSQWALEAISPPKAHTSSTSSDDVLTLDMLKKINNELVTIPKLLDENQRLKAQLAKLQAFFPQDNSPTLGGDHV